MTPESRQTFLDSTLLRNSGVLGVGYGLKETNGEVTSIPAWRVYVRSKTALSQLSAADRVPVSIAGIATDVVARSMTSQSAGSVTTGIGYGSRIANSRGVPGTLGCLAHTLQDRRPVFLSNWHVLFGNGAEKSGQVWLVDETDGTRRFSGIGRSLYGKIGTVRLDGEDYYVDCAVGSFLPPERRKRRPGQRAWARASMVTGHDTAKPGYRVTKTGAATGITSGIVVDTNYPDFVWIEGRAYSAPGQLLVQPIKGCKAFSDEGDSGAVITNTANKVVGLLWGTNCRGEGIACPIGPVLNSLNIVLGLPLQPGLRERAWRWLNRTLRR